MDSLFTNIPLEKITIPIKSIHNEKDTVEGLCKSEFKMLLTLATKQYYYFQWIIVQKKIDSVVIDSSPGPTLPNAFVFFNRKVWYEQCP